MSAGCMAVPGLGEVLAGLAGGLSDTGEGRNERGLGVTAWEYVVPDECQQDGFDRKEKGFGAGEGESRGGGAGEYERVTVSTGEGLAYRYVAARFKDGTDDASLGNNAIVVARAVLNRRALLDLSFPERERKVAEMERNAILAQLENNEAASVEDVGRLMEVDPVIDRHAHVALPSAFRNLIGPALCSHVEPSGVDEGQLGRDVNVDWTPSADNTNVCSGKSQEGGCSPEIDADAKLGAACRTFYTAPYWPAPGKGEAPEDHKASLRRKVQEACKNAVRKAVVAWSRLPPLSILNRDAVRSAVEALRLAKAEGRSEEMHESPEEPRKRDEKILAVMELAYGLGTEGDDFDENEHSSETSVFETAAIESLAKFAVLFHKVERDNITHPELYVCLCNRAAVYGTLGLHEEALADAIDAELRAGKTRSSRVHVRKGRALVGLRQYRAAEHAFEDALRIDPKSAAPKAGLTSSQRGLTLALENGRAQQRLLTAVAAGDAATTRAITSLPASVHKESLSLANPLPTALLAPTAAENDDRIHDAYNYLQTMCDIRMPRRYVTGYMEDGHRLRAFASALRAAIARAAHRHGSRPRVLHLGAGGGLLSLVAKDAGAEHVTCVERWQYMSQACARVLTANGGADEAFKVVCRRMHELDMGPEGVPHPCHVTLLDDVFDDGLLSRGYLLALKNAHRRGLIAPGAEIVPRSAHVWCQPVQVKTRPIDFGNDGGRLSFEAMDVHRWLPIHSHGIPFSSGAVIPLGPPVPVFDFFSDAPPETAAECQIEFSVERTGAMNAVQFWYSLDLGGGHTPEVGTGLGSPLTSLRPALQYLPGEIRLYKGATVPMLARHNTAQLRFEVVDGDFATLAKQDASFPHASAFSMLSDRRRLAGYAAALKDALGPFTLARLNGSNSSKPTPSAHDAGAEVARRSKVPAWKRRTRETETSAGRKAVRVLDVGTGSGALAMIAARFGATDVVAVELRESLALAARRNVSRNNLNDRVTVAHADIHKVVRGREVWRHPADIVVMDVFDTATLGGDPARFISGLRARGVVTEMTKILPRAASVWAIGVECLTADPLEGGAVGDGYDLSALDAFRDTGGAEPIFLQRHRHRVLTEPVRLCLQQFDRVDDHGLGESTACMFPVVTDGTLNAICYWYDVHLDADITLSNSPTDPENQDAPHYWGQALRQLPATAVVRQDTSVPIEVLRPTVRGPYEFRLRPAGPVAGADAQGAPSGASTISSRVRPLRLVPHARPPWLVPDTSAFHRVHICDLLFANFAKRVAYRARGGAQFTEDASMRRFTTHCASLALCPRVIAEVLLELASQERVQNERRVDADNISSEELVVGATLALC